MNKKPHAASSSTATNSCSSCSLTYTPPPAPKRVLNQTNPPFTEPLSVPHYKARRVTADNPRPPFIPPHIQQFPGLHRAKSLPKTQDATESNLFDQFEKLAIHRQRKQLRDEVLSLWPYPNKERKLTKMEALGQLVKNSDQFHDVPTAILQLKKTYPQATKGFFSTRTADLLNALNHQHASRVVTRQQQPAPK